jgi:hypothetical protein
VSNAKRAGAGAADPLLLKTTTTPSDSTTTIANQARRGGRRSRDKGNRVEWEIVDRHTALGIKAERYPLSGASRFRGSGHDVDVYAFGADAAPIVCEVKGRKSGAGFVTLEKWLSEYDAFSSGAIMQTRWSFCRGGCGRGC